MNIIRTFPGEKDFHLFEELTSTLYDESLLPLKQTESVPTRHLEGCFVVLVDDKPLARVSLYVNPELKYEGKRTACLGTFEAVNDEKIVRRLIEHAIEQAKELEAEYIIGPMNGSTWENYRFSAHNNYPNFFLEPYHHTYYNELFVSAGFNSIGDYHSILDKDVVYKVPGAKDKEVYFREKGVQFKTANLDEFEKVLTDIHELNLIAYQSNFLYTPIEEEAFIDKYVKAKQFIDPQFLLLAYSTENKLIGYYFCSHDFYNTNDKCLILKSIARHPDEQYRGLGHAIGYQIYETARQQGYTSTIHAFMYDDGTSAPLSKHFSENEYKKYTLYGKAI